MRLVLLVSVLTFAQNLAAADLPLDAAKALSEYQRTRTEGIARLNNGLIERLSAMQKTHMSAGRLDSANAIQLQIEILKAENDSLARTSTDSAVSNGTRPVGASAAKPVIVDASEAKISGGLREWNYEGVRLTGWDKGAAAVWNRAKVQPGTYKILVLAGGLRPLDLKMEISIGEIKHKFELWPNSGGNPLKDFEVGIVTIPSSMEGVELKCIEIKPSKVAATPEMKPSTHFKSITLTPQ